MDLFNRTELKALLQHTQGPCVSLYMPAQRGGAEADPIRWKNVLGKAQELLAARGLRGPQVRDFLRPAALLLEDPVFWKEQSDGLAFFLAPGLDRSYRLPLRLPELAVVGDHFHLKPLLPWLTGDGRFYVLAFSQNQVRLLQGSAHGVQEVDLKKVPPNLAEALRFHDRDEPLRVHTRPAGGVGSWGAIFSGQGVGIDTVKDDLRLYFRQIDRGLHEVLRDEQAPLLLAAVESLWPLYREMNTYAHLLETGVPGNPDRLSAAELHARAWAVVQPHFEEARRRTAALYAQLAGTGRTSRDLGGVVRAAYQGQVEALFVAADRECWGSFAPTTGQVAEHARAEPGDQDLLNLAATFTLTHGGTVYAVTAGQVPGAGPLAAIFWLPNAKKEK